MNIPIERDSRGRFVKGTPTWCKGKNLSFEHRQKLSLAKLGRKQSPEHIAKRSIILSKIMNGKIPAIYKNETIEQRKNRMHNLTLMKRSKSHNKQFPHSIPRMKEYLQMHDKIYGKNCYLCGYQGRMELHHLWYVHNKFSRKGSANILRKIEAIQHPERFVRLCRPCHSAITLVQMYGQKIIDGLQLLHESSTNRTPIQCKIGEFYAKDITF